MKMLQFKILFPILILLLITCTHGQKNHTNDPSKNGRLSEQFNPEQIDFHNEYYELKQKIYSKYPNNLDQAKITDFSSIWISGDWDQNGIIGTNYQRIQIHIEMVRKDSSKTDLYKIEGKSKVRSTICDFKGEIKILKAFFLDQCEDSEKKNCGVLFTEYSLYEDSLQDHSGCFQGISETLFFINSDDNVASLDDTFDGADGYSNRTFVGTWTDYKTNIHKKCIWGDYRLPFTFDFDQGDGEMRVNDKYEKNGWLTFNTGEEFEEQSNGKIGLKDKWWLTRKK